jgi:PiT family inorganic phosphate transporter
MTVSIVLLVLVIVGALVFEYINGFHDAANAIATVVSTKVMTPRQAVVYGAALEFTGALTGTHVAKTIGAGIIDPSTITLHVIFCALCAAIIWNLITWYFGLPSSSSHALIGGLIGAAIVNAGCGCVRIFALVDKVITPMFMAPVIGFCTGLIVMAILLRLFYKVNPDKVNRRFRRCQIFSAGFMALSHGSNDAQKTMGIITLALLAGGVIQHNGEGSFDVPIYVILSCAVVMCLGVMSGGWKIIRTMGGKIIKLKPINGFAAETSASSIILAASHFGVPLSTTHVISTAIMGVGTTYKAHAVKWGVIGNIVWAWVLTIPICMLISGTIFTLYKFFIL